MKGPPAGRGPRRPLAAGLVLIAAACSGRSGPAPAVPAGTSVILICLDTCRADRVSAYGEAERTLTPALDELAAESALFTDCRAPSTGTAPSHASLFTGQYVHRHGLEKNGQSFQPAFTLAALLHEAGWQTAGFTGGGYLRRKYGVAEGFEEWFANGGRDEPGAALGRGQGDRSIGNSLPDLLEWLDARGEAPFFAFLHGYDPHCPHSPPAAIREELAGWYAGGLELSGLCGEDFHPLLQSGQLDATARRYLSDLYDGEVRHADQTLAGFVARLRQAGRLDRSLLVFTSDHGESLGDHDWVGHMQTWEEQFRVPLLIRFPGGRFAGRYDAPVQLLDVLPTLLEAVGLAIPAGVQGRSLLPLLRGEEDLPADRMRVGQYGGLVSVRFGKRWKIAFRQKQGRTDEEALYDLDADPGETRNLCATPAGKRRFEDLYGRYRAWRAESAEEDRRFRAGGAEPEVSPQERADLEELGYVETGGE